MRDAKIDMADTELGRLGEVKHQKLIQSFAALPQNEKRYFVNDLITITEQAEA